MSSHKISALEAYKVSIILDDMVQKLQYMDQLKNNLGEEMTEMMSEEITKAMDEQKRLEQEYAQLVEQRS